MELVQCGICGIKNVRLYRPYGECRRRERDRCNLCLSDEERFWYVPLIIDSADGLAWGYTSAPKEAVDSFFAMPEKSPDAPSWQEDGWSSVIGAAQ